MSKQLTVTCDHCKKPIENPDPTRRFEIVNTIGETNVLATVTLNVDTDLHPECRAGLVGQKTWRAAETQAREKNYKLAPNIAWAIAQLGGAGKAGQIFDLLKPNDEYLKIESVYQTLTRSKRFVSCGNALWRDVEAKENQGEGEPR